LRAPRPVQPLVRPRFRSLTSLSAACTSAVSVLVALPFGSQLGEDIRHDRVRTDIPP
jgi:hypothetical protein